MFIVYLQVRKNENIIIITKRTFTGLEEGSKKKGHNCAKKADKLTYFVEFSSAWFVDNAKDASS